MTTCSLNPWAWRNLAALPLGTLLLFLLFRAFVTQGYLFPIRIAGNSMVPSFMGDHVEFVCPHCGITSIVEPRMDASPPVARCSNCSAELDAYANAVAVRADRVLIDKLTYRRRNPRRGEVVALRDPMDPNRLVVKRIAGLPNESIEIVSGTLHVNGSPGACTVDDLLITVNDDRYRRNRTSRWENLGGEKWKQTPMGFSIDARGDPERVSWLVYRHANHVAGSEPGIIYDDNVFNLSVRRKLHPTSNLFVSGHVKVNGEGSLFLRCDVGAERWTCEYDVGANNWFVRGQPRTRTTLANADMRFRIARENKSVRFSSDDLVLSDDIPSSETANATGFLIGATNLRVELSELIVQRAHYITVDSPRPVATRSWNLGPREYFLLGDNSPISVDSRSWQKRIRRSELIGLVRHD